MNSAYMKHLGIELPPLRIRCEIDREKRQVHAVLEDDFDSVLLISFFKELEKAEEIRLIDRRINSGEGPISQSRLRSGGKNLSLI